MKFLIAFAILLTAICAKPFGNGKDINRIIGGRPAVAGQFPFAAAIYFTSSDGGRYFCAGSIIAPQWILTSGQCQNNAIQFEIHVGSHHLAAADENKRILYTSHSETPPDFDPDFFVADIALIKLNLPITYTPYIARIDLAYDHIDDGAAVVAIGWGQTSDTEANLSETLQVVDLAVVSLDDCRRAYLPEYINDNMICVNGNNNEGLCIGDTGSALIQFNELTRTSRQVGVASFIKNGACEGTAPSGYTRLFSHRDWISQTAGV